MKRTFLFTVLAVVASISSAQDYDYSTGSYGCFEVLEFPDVVIRQGMPAANECWIPGRKYETAGEPYTWQIMFPLEINVSGSKVSVKSGSEIYQAHKGFLVHYTTTVELSGSLNGKECTMHGSSYNVSKTATPVNDPNDLITMTIKFEGADSLLVDLTQVQRDTKGMVFATNHFLTRYKRL